ncbi:hypothetical protein BSQ39_08310 [Loigolactobacillus backii]|uniref:hypothetical protein n=1 Tax=Loigolactobacillus backii TaxID=375175 RepID=UPI000C1CA9FF|nr:hypothetical protein [Loigolactobacillus backii]PIO83565.1 hypothetical protein BSQ39_08310 [Loigolactobacillus backii]
MDIELTNDAKYFLAIAYKKYLTDIKNGLSKQKSKYLDDVPTIQTTLISEWSRQDISDLVEELQEQGFLDTEQYWGPFPSEIQLTNKAIIYNEEKFKRNTATVVDFIAKLKSLIF